jgi:hypothetical protein
LKILLRKSPEAQWQKLEPFDFGDENKLEKLLEKSPDLLTIEGGKPILFFTGQVPLGNNAADLLGVDADGTIVIVECKLAKNPEARRTVVGQILEYAAQVRGTSYGAFETKMTGSSGLSLIEKARELVSEDGWDEENFKDGIKRSLELGNFRLVIAINGLNDELKGIIEYLKAQGGVRLEALELRRFKHDASGVEVLVPELYGLPSRTTGTRVIRTWNWENFEADAIKKHLDGEQIKAIKEFHDRLRTDLRAEIKWGTGDTIGWFGAKWPFCSATAIGATSMGKLAISFGNLGKSDEEKAFRERLREMAGEFGLTVAEDFETKYPNYDFNWVKSTPSLLASLKDILPGPSA